MVQTKSWCLLLLVVVVGGRKERLVRENGKSETAVHGLISVIFPKVRFLDFLLQKSVVSWEIGRHWVEGGKSAAFGDGACRSWQGLQILPEWGVHEVI